MINYKNEILSMMTNSELAAIIIDKKKEINIRLAERYKIDDYIEKNKDRIKHGIIYLKAMLSHLVYQNKIKECEKIINMMNIQLDIRNPYSIKNKIDLDELKNIDIISLVENIAGIQIGNSRRNIKCIFSDHNDKTASLHFYDKTNTFKCFGCHKGGTTIDLIKHYFSLKTNKEAIEKLYNIKIK